MWQDVTGCDKVHPVPKNNLLETVEAAQEYGWCIDSAITEKINKGYSIIRSCPTKILLDLDSPTSIAAYETMLPVLTQRFCLGELDRYESSTPGHIHIVLLCRDLPFDTRLSIQMALGSDMKREALALLMHAEGIHEPSFLARPKGH